MCLGIPMTVVATSGFTAVVEGFGERRDVHTLLVGELAVGAAVLVHRSDVVRVLAPEEIAPLTEAIGALAAALRGEDIGAAFADLTARPPELPAHLRPKEAELKKKKKRR